jgi:hypothetical protein
MAQESKIEKSVCEYARENGYYVRKFSSPAHRGVPDQIFLSPHGVVIFIEFKAPRKLPTALQLREHKLISMNCGFVHVVDSVEVGKFLVEKYLEKSINLNQLAES